MGGSIIKQAHSLRLKIILLTCGVALIVALVTSAVAYWRAVHTAADAAIENLAGETRLLAARVKDIYDEMANDAFVVSRTPPVLGIYRAQRNAGVDPRERVSAELWRSRLESIFVLIMQARPHYLQMRYIGIAGNGRELVRVNRRNNDFERVPPARLSEKGGEPYFRTGLALRPGETYFSEVTFNQEHGRVDGTLMPTVRVLVPVYVPGEGLYGLIVINADYRAFVNRAFQKIDPTKETYVVNRNGSYFAFYPGPSVGIFEFHDSHVGRLSSFIGTMLRTRGPEALVENDGHIGYFVKLDLNDSNPRNFVGVAQRAPEDALLADAYAARRHMAWLSLALVAAALAGAGVLARRFTEPLRKMTGSIARSCGDATKLDLPVHLDDEIGALARVLRDAMKERDRLIGRLERSNRELDQFAYVASHDLKAPLRVIDNASAWLEEDLSDLDYESRETLRLLRKRVRRMQRLLDDLLEYSRIGRKADPRAAEVVRGADMIADIRMLLAQPTGFSVTFSPRLAALRLPRMPLQQVLLNLIDNAIKHHDKAAGHVAVSVEEDGDFYSFAVGDDGPGIPEQYQEKVFEMFRTLRSRDRVEGSGLGLAMVKKHVELAGGSLTLQSNEGEGCFFRFTWPKHRAAEPEPRERHVARPSGQIESYPEAVAVYN